MNTKLSNLKYFPRVFQRFDFCKTPNWMPATNTWRNGLKGLLTEHRMSFRILGGVLGLASREEGNALSTNTQKLQWQKKQLKLSEIQYLHYFFLKLCFLFLYSIQLKHKCADWNCDISVTLRLFYLQEYWSMYSIKSGLNWKEKEQVHLRARVTHRLDCCAMSVFHGSKHSVSLTLLHMFTNCQRNFTAVLAI